MDPQLRNGMLMVFIGMVLLFTTLLIEYPLWLWAMVLAASFVVAFIGARNLWLFIKRS
ncbi:hypothetical protein [Geomicrobium sp. JCM 19039]|uniref:hypothetical protein n=1 Tax=Geomicrobium sp. JCM 19039 TaxID=1460636 RepID=UPI00045F33E0|nr:hypothetical protein [Geomicrobium sp. JCM 19039]GAK14109.1 hypothetical protein JCM19039_4006 [Geomicrobium sp. JCM 19039]